MKKTLYILMGAALVLASCEKVQEVKSLEIERTSGIHQAEAWSEFIQGTGTVNAIGDEAYYQNLRDWKKAAFDADGGCPKKGSLDYQEMKACQEIKGMKVVGCRITRILENARWGMEAQIPSFMKAYEAYKYDNMGKILQGKMTAQELESAALEAGNAALRADVQAHPGKGANSREAEGGPEWPEWCVYASQVLLDEIEQYGLDGYDLDYEPEGDPLSGTAFNTMVAYLSQFIGPKSGNEGTLLIIDRNSGAGDKDLAKLCNFWIYQKYGSTGGASPASQGDFGSNLDRANGWVPAQIIVTENVGDTYSEGCHNLEQMARFQPSTCGQQYHIMGIRAQSQVEYYK